jgi:hypothetical protein
MRYDNKAVEPVSPAAYAEARDRGAGVRVTAYPHITALLTANGHSPDKAAEVVRVAQRSWSKNLT